MKMSENPAGHVDKRVYDITVIGGGPAGLFATLYAGIRNCSVKLIESLPQLGGQLAALYPEKYIYDVAGFPKVRAQKLVDQLIEQMNLFNPTVCLEEQVLKVEKLEERSFRLTTNKGVHYSKAVIITAGVGAFEPRKLPLDNIEHFEKTNLYYFVRDMNLFKGKRVLIAGGGDSAVDWALMLEPVAKEVTLVHRRDTFRAHEHSVENLKKSSVRIMTPKEIIALEGDTEIRQVILQDNKTKEQTTVDVDAVIVNFGFVSSLGPIKDWGLEIEGGSIKVNSHMETNIPGIFAAGDIATYPGKIKLIATGFGEAPMAVSNAKLYIDPSARLQPGHSSSLNL